MVGRNRKARGGRAALGLVALSSFRQPVGRGPLEMIARPPTTLDVVVLSRAPSCRWPGWRLCRRLKSSWRRATRSSASARPNSRSSCRDHHGQDEGGRSSLPVRLPRTATGSVLEVEPAGIEPATSWVRFGRPNHPNSLTCRTFSERRSFAAHARSPCICRRFTGVKARELALWPQRISDAQAVSRPRIRASGPSYCFRPSGRAGAIARWRHCRRRSRR